MSPNSPPKPKERAVVFVDANNCYHALRELGVGNLKELSYAKISQKIVGERDWLATHFYVGQLRNDGNKRLYNDQRAYLAFLEASDKRISVHFGRFESHKRPNPLAQRLKRYMADLKVRIDNTVFRDLIALGNAYEFEVVTQEKAVDVALAVDLVMMAQRDAYDVAYLLSADGDFTPAVRAAQALGKKVFVASPGRGAQIAAASYMFLPLEASWFNDCFAP